MIDPIDGTMNFVHNNPQSCVSLALFVNKSTQIGIILNPSLDKLYTARYGQGAFCNGTPIHVSDVSDIGKSLVSTEFGPIRDNEAARIELENLSKVLRVVHGYVKINTIV